MMDRIEWSAQLEINDIQIVPLDHAKEYDIAQSEFVIFATKHREG